MEILTVKWQAEVTNELQGNSESVIKVTGNKTRKVRNRRGGGQSVFARLQNHDKMKRVQINRREPAATWHKHKAVFYKLSVGKQLHRLVTVRVFVRCNLQTPSHEGSEFTSYLRH
jgi:ribosomal protein S17E